ncbi:MAG TPA: mechanosensitive ion channel family protein [Blattabacteriaceae bacterium]
MFWNFFLIWKKLLSWRVIGYLFESLSILLGAFLKILTFNNKFDKTKSSVLRNYNLLFFLSIIFIFPPLKNFGYKLLTVSAILILVYQKFFIDFSSSISLLISQPFRFGDYFETSKGFSGYVQEITLRHTVIRTVNNNKIVFPVRTLNEEFIINNNIGDIIVRKNINIKIYYSFKLNLAIKIIKEEVEKHPFCIDGRTYEEKKNYLPLVLVKITSFNDFSLNLRTFVWAEDNSKGIQLEWDCLNKIINRFEKEEVFLSLPKIIILKNFSYKGFCFIENV